MIKKSLISLFCLIAFLSCVSFAEKTLITKKFVLKTEPSKHPHTIDVEYLESNQARLSGLQFKITNKNEKTPSLKISGQIRNMLKRTLVNARVVAECFDENEESLDAGETTTIPKAIDTENRPGHFLVTLDYSEDIASCKIDISWPGKED